MKYEINKSRLFIRNIIKSARKENLDVPISIGVTERFADSIRPYLLTMIRYSTINDIPPNQIMYMGITLIAPSHYKWR